MLELCKQRLLVDPDSGALLVSAVHGPRSPLDDEPVRQSAPSDPASSCGGERRALSGFA